MVWKWLGAVLLLPVQMLYLVLKAAVCALLPPKLRDLSGDTVLVTGGGRGIGRQLAREFARRGARKVRWDVGMGTCCCVGPGAVPEPWGWRGEGAAGGRLTSMTWACPALGLGVGRALLHPSGFLFAKSSHVLSEATSVLPFADPV